MFTSALGTLSGYLNRRFLVTIWLPSLLFWSVLLSLHFMHIGIATATRWWQLQSGEIQALLIILSLAWITFFAYLLNAQLGSILRVYEGYWDHVPFGPYLARGRKAYYRSIIRDLENQGDWGTARIYYEFPAALNEVMPTRLGNHLRSAEVYPHLRYQINTAVVWPRLYSVLPDRLVAEVAEAKSQLDLMIVVSLLGALFSLLGGAYALIMLPWYGFPASIWSGVLVAWAGYRGALGSAVPYCELIKSAFDLHRGTLLKTIGWNPAQTFGKEREQWKQISALWYLGLPEGREGARQIGYPGSTPDQQKGISFE